MTGEPLEPKPADPVPVTAFGDVDAAFTALAARPFCFGLGVAR